MIKILCLTIIILLNILYQPNSLAEEAHLLKCKFDYVSIKTNGECRFETSSVYPNMYNASGDCSDYWFRSETGFIEEDQVDKGDKIGNNWDANGKWYETYIFCSYIQKGSSSYAINTCYQILSSLNQDFLDDIKRGSLEISFNEYSIYPGDSIYNNLNSIGCTTNNSTEPSDSNDCTNIYEYLFNKLSTKFPLDMFMPAYNFSADETACPTISLFGEDLQFCAIVMVASSVKYIFIITFIIRSVIHF